MKRSEFLTQTNEAADVKEYLDETYSFNVRGISQAKVDKVRLGWCRIGVDKRDDRTIPIIKGGPKTQAAFEIIKQWVRQTAIYGNSSLIVKNDTGDLEVSNPLDSTATFMSFKNRTFYQDNGIVGVNGNVFYVDEKDNVFEIDANVFSLFHKADVNHPFGQSVILKSARQNTAAASRNLLRIEQIAQSGAVKKYLLNGLDEDMALAYASSSQEEIDAIKSMFVGLGDFITIPANRQGDKLSVETVDAQDPTPYLEMQKMFLKNTAATFDLNPREMGENFALPTSAEAILLEKEDLGLKVSTFTKGINGDVLLALEHIALINGEEKPELSWEPPLPRSVSSMADAFSKLVNKTSSDEFRAWALEAVGFSADNVAKLFGGK